MRYFNTAGPCDPRHHYMVPAANRAPELRPLIERGGYVVLHAPRQTGKTTTLRALAAELTAEGRYAALHLSCEAASAGAKDVEESQRAILFAMEQSASRALPKEVRPPSPWPPPAPALSLLSGALAAWAGTSPRPLVLFFDEIDSLQGDHLINVLRQLRAGYPDRPTGAPWAVVLCGLRDVRDYKAASGGDATRLGSSSPFNIKVESLRLGDFTKAELQALYAQHQNETGQVFQVPAIERAWSLSQGQPWLANALARELVDKMAVPANVPITAVHVDEAKERLILERATHLDSLVARLNEPRVRRVLEPLLAGATTGGDTYQDDFEYVRDLGLIRDTRPARISNPIYNEVIVRVLADAAEIPPLPPLRSFTFADGRLDPRKLLEEFVGFWRQHGELLTGVMTYHEVAPQLVLMAFLQRVVNGGGYVEREYGIGRGRIDLLVRWPYPSPAAPSAWQREAIELKVWAPNRPDPMPEALAQLDDYLAQLGLDAGTLIIFDRRPQAEPIVKRTRFEEAQQTRSGRRVLVLRA